MLNQKVREKLFNAGYRIVGNHSAIKLCHWTRESLSHNRNCYKRWYAIESHRCMQMTPALQCNFNCVFCWRFHGIIPFKEAKWDEPKFILNECIKAQRELLTGFSGNPNVSKKKFKEANDPKHVAISLDGEPTFYPILSELIAECKKRDMTTFLVTNGSLPERIKLLKNEPTNFYISLSAPDRETFLKVDKPINKNSWEKLSQSLELMNSFKCRKVIRITLVKGLNMINVNKYAKLVLKASPDFIEPKAFMHVSESQKRLPRESMPEHEDIRKFAEDLSKETGYIIKDEDRDSRIVLLGKG